MQNEGPPPQGAATPPTTFSAILRKRLDELRWTHVEASERLDVKPRTLTGYLAGDLDESVAKFPRIASALGITTSELLGERPPSPEIGADQILVTFGQRIVDDAAYDIVLRGGTLPKGEGWSAAVRAGVRAVTREEYETMRAALSKTRRR